MATEILSAALLRELFSYDANTGVFTRIRRAGPRGMPGSVAGCRKHGYIRIGILGRSYAAHRLAWLIVHGAWPADDIDHIDGNKTNNAIANLRDVPTRVNLQNRLKASRNSSTGLLGVTRSGARWRAAIRFDGECINLGCFCTPELAHAAYIDAKRKMHPGCTI